jgi:hypothetical protein
MTSGAGTPSRFQPQGPASRCVIQGRALGWLNCTCNSFAMATDQGSANRARLTGCDFRESTGDTAGGTTLAQNAPLAEAHGVDVDIYVGSHTATNPGVVTPFWAALQLQAGRGVVVQGNTSALLNTSSQSTGSGVNHAVFVSAVKGGSSGAPSHAFVFDPAADGRRAGWGTAAQGPQWWPWSRLLAFAAALRPWGDGDPRKLGPGKWYCAVFPDTNPHVHLRKGARKSSPFPDRTRIDRTGGQWSYRSPAYGTTNRSQHYADGELFVAYQYITVSDRNWVGNHSGGQWIPAANLAHVGGNT